MYWINAVVDGKPGHRCTRHSTDFPIGEVCHACVTDPGAAPGDVAEDPAYQRELASRVNEYRGNSRSCMNECKRLRDEGEAIDGNLAVKWSAEAVKWARLAEERQDILDNREHDLELIRHERDMSGKRRGN